MTHFVVHDEDGKILRTGVTQEEHVIPYQASAAGEAVIIGVADSRTDYVLDGAVTPRPAMVCTIDKFGAAVDEVITIAGLPMPVEVYVDGVLYPVPDGVLELTVSLSGVVAIRCEAFPFLNAEFSVEVTA